MTIHPEKNRIRLTYLRAGNLRSLRNVRLDIGPRVTVLAGPNASGKSNIVDAMNFVYDAIYDGVEHAVGDRGTRAMLHRHGGYFTRGFTIGLGLESSTFVAEHMFRIGITRSNDVSIDYERISGMTIGHRRRRFDFRLKDSYFYKPPPSNISNELSGKEFPSDYLMLSVMGDSLDVAQRLASSLLDKNGPTIESASVAQTIVDMANFMGEMSFYRLFPNILREPTPPKPGNRLVEDGTNLASVLRRIVRQEDEAYWDLIGALGSVIPDIDDVRVRQFGGYQYIQLKHHSLVSSTGEGGWLDLSSESDGTVRTLALLVALYQNPPPSLICIEEPELNVHLGALGILADTLNEVGLRSQVIVTTHSSDLLDYFQEDAIRAVIAKEGRTRAGRLRKNQLKALRESLFKAGELHRMEGLSLDELGD